METREWKTFDIHYNEDEEEKVNKIIKRMQKRGWLYQQTDNYGSGGRDLVAQLISNTKIKVMDHGK